MMASKASEWAQRYATAERARESVRREKPSTIRLKLAPGRSVEITPDDYGNPFLTSPMVASEGVDVKDLLLFAQFILDSYGVVPADPKKGKR